MPNKQIYSRDGRNKEQTKSDGKPVTLYNSVANRKISSDSFNNLGRGETDGNNDQAFTNLQSFINKQRMI